MELLRAAILAVGEFVVRREKFRPKNFVRAPARREEIFPSARIWKQCLLTELAGMVFIAPMIFDCGRAAGIGRPDWLETIVAVACFAGGREEQLAQQNVSSSF